MTLYNKDKIIKCLIILLPIALVFSIFISELILFLISIFFIKDYLKERKSKKNFFFIFLFFFFLYISISSISFDEGITFKSTFFYFRFLLYFCAIIYYLEKINVYNNLLKSFIFTGSILIIDGIIQFWFGFNLLGMKPLSNRISSFFGDELILGSYLVRLLPFYLIFFIFNFKKNLKLKLLFFLPFLIIIIMSGERTAIFLLFLSFFIFFILIKDLRKIILIFLSFFIIIFSVLVTFNQSYNERYFYNLLNSFGIIDGNKKVSLFNEKNERKDIYIFSKQHEHHFITAYKMFKDKYFFGHGPKSFRVLCKDEKYKVSELSCATHPHNILMQFLSELGLLGFVFLFIFQVLLLIELVKIVRSKNIENEIRQILLISLVGIIINIFPLIPSGNFFNNWLSIILTLNLVNYIYLRSKYLNA